MDDFFPGQWKKEDQWVKRFVRAEVRKDLTYRGERLCMTY